MRQHILALSLGAAGLTLAALPAAAGPGGSNGPACAPRAKVVALLAERHRETRRGVGLAGPARMVEVFASEEGSWSVIVTDTRGVACLIASGRDWEDSREALPPGGEGA